MVDQEILAYIIACSCQKQNHSTRNQRSFLFIYPCTIAAQCISSAYYPFAFMFSSMHGIQSWYNCTSVLLYPYLHIQSCIMHACIHAGPSEPPSTSNASPAAVVKPSRCSNNPVVAGHTFFPYLKVTAVAVSTDLFLNLLMYMLLQVCILYPCSCSMHSILLYYCAVT